MPDSKGFYARLATPTGAERWRVAFRKQADWACIDWGKRTIWCRPGQSPAELADTLIHEAIHVGTGFGDGHEPTIERPIIRCAGNGTAMLLKAGLLVGDDD
jgi:hypothetical protein